MQTYALERDSSGAIIRANESLQVTHLEWLVIENEMGRVSVELNKITNFDKVTLQVGDHRKGTSKRTHVAMNFGFKGLKNKRIQWIHRCF